MTATQVVLALAAPVVMGWLLADLLLPIGCPLGLRLATAWCAGSLALASVLWVLCWTGALTSGLVVVAVLATSALVVQILRRWLARGRRAIPGARSESRLAVEALAFRAVLALCAVVLVVEDVADYSRPVNRGDEATIWAGTAKLAFHAGGFNARYSEMAREDAATGIGLMAHHDYPPLNPMLQLWVYVLAGHIVHFENRFIIEVFGFAALAVMASAIGGRVRGIVAASILLVVVGFPEFHLSARAAISDGIVALGLAAALDSWLRFQETGRGGYWRACCLFLTVLVWTKHEGLLLLTAIVGAAAAGALVSRSGRASLRNAFRSRSRWCWALLPLLYASATWIGNRAMGLSNDLVGSGVEPVAGGTGGTLWAGLHALSWDRFVQVLRLVLFDVVLDVREGHGLFLIGAVLGAACLIRDPGRRTVLGLPSLALLVMFLGYGAVFLCTPMPLEWHWNTAARRVFFHLAPAVGVLLAATLARSVPPPGTRMSEP